MASMQGIPLLTGPPSTVDSSDACRKCNKEFNFLFTRSRKCNHCGYLYCHSCSDFQALMPRSGHESGYDPVHVCCYCIELLNLTAAAIGQLRGTSLGKLKSYADSYNINISGAVEKGDIVDAIIRARQPNGCLSQPKEDYYRKNKVPNPHAGSRPRSLFSRGNSADAPPPPVPPRPQAPNVPPRFNQTHATPPSHHRPYGASSGHSAHYENYSSPYASYYSNRHRPPPSSYNASPHASPFAQRQQPPPPPQETRPPPPPRPNTTSVPRPAFRPQATPSPQTPPQRQRTTSAPSQPHTSSPPPAAPIPTLDQLLVMTQASIGALPISVLKNILFTNHVNASMILEKSELVSKVIALIDDEKRERERQRSAEEAERLEEEERRREREEAIRRGEEQRRRGEEERLKKERRERQRPTVEDVEDGVDDMMDIEVEISEDEDEYSDYHDESGGVSEPSTSATPPKTAPMPQKPITAAIERSGLCVICQDEEANIAIVDCGHLAMCRACSELIMASSKECPLCRTRIVTDARLLRIFKS